MNDLLDALNPPQREAVLYDGGPLLVLAGAGSGKTRVLTHRIAHLVRVRGVPPWAILAITFTNKAAGEMRDRLERLVGPAARGMWASTFHSACVRILRRECERIGYDRDFSILDEDDQLRALKACYEEERLDPKRVAPRAVLSRISDAKNRLLGADDLAERAASFSDDLVVRLYRGYERRLRANQAMDFDDLLMFAVDLLESDDEVRQRYQQRFAHVLVDEYQDTNHAQFRLVQILGEPQRNVMVVGDDDQGIYSWRGADIRNILDFERHYPDAHAVALEQNYRSTGTILRAANAVVMHNAGRHAKRLWTDGGDGEPIAVLACGDEHDEARAVAGLIGRAIEDGTSAAELAVFYRTNAQSRVLEDTLVRMGTPYQVIGGPKFYDRAEVRDALAYLRAVANPADAGSFARMMGTPRRGLGQAFMSRLIAHATRVRRPVGEAAGDPEFLAGLRPGQRSALQDLLGLLDDLRQQAAAGLPLDRLMDGMLDRSGLRAALEGERTLEAQGRLEVLRELVGVGAEYQARAEEPSLGGFLQEIALYADADALQEEVGRVTLMTIHNAKGLEYDTVFIVGMEEGVFPHSRSDTPAAVEEERRLCYVGLTRARRRLVLTHAHSRMMYGGRDYRLPSRFLAELPEDALARPPVGGGPGARRAARAIPLLSVGDEVVHATFGEGVILDVERQGELVRVRFARDGAERRLMAGAAPMRKVS